MGRTSTTSEPACRVWRRRRRSLTWCSSRSPRRATALQLAGLLHRCHGFDVTFVHTERNRLRLLRARGPGALAGAPGFRFAAVPDGLPPSDEDAARDDAAALLLSLPTVVPQFKDLVLSELPAASCRRLLLVSDIDPILRAAREIGLPCVTFWITSASSFMAMQQVQHLVAKGLVPLKGTVNRYSLHLKKTSHSRNSKTN